MSKRLGFIFIMIFFSLPGKSQSFQCIEEAEPSFSSSWEKENFERSVLTEFQLWALKKTAQSWKSLAIAANKSELFFEDYVKKLVQNECSKNRTVIGQKKLLQLLTQEPLREIQELNPEQALKAFSLKSINIQLLCSWAGNLLNSSHLDLLLSDELIIGQFIQDLKKMKIYVECDGSFCRKNSMKTPNQKVIGGGLYYRNAKSFLCHSKSQRRYRLGQKKTVLPVEKSLLIDQLYVDSLEKQNLWLRLDEVSSFSEMIWKKIEHRLLESAENKLQKLSYYFFHQESLKLEVLKHESWERVPGLSLRLSYGPYDRSLNSLDKISAQFTLELTQGVKAWINSSLITYRLLEEPEPWAIFKEKLVKVLSEKIAIKNELFSQTPWEQDITKIIAHALIDKVDQQNKPTYLMVGSKPWIVPIKIYYGLFALDYIQSKYEKRKALAYFKEPQP